MAGTQIVSPIYMVNLGGVRSDLVAWLARRSLEPADLGGHLLYIIFFSYFISFIIMNYFLQVI